MVLSKKKSRIGKMIVRITIEKILAFITGTGINLGVLEKKKMTPNNGIINGWNTNDMPFKINSFIQRAS